MKKIKIFRHLLVSFLLPVTFLFLILAHLHAAGQFEDSGQRLGGDITADAGLADLDGDSDPDLFTANSQGNHVWINQGGAQNGDAGFFANSGQNPGFLNSRGVALGDVDGNDTVDAFVANNGDRQVWLNNGSAQFSLGKSLPSANSDGQDVALGYLDGDQALDAFVVNHGPNEVWLNNGSGGFKQSQSDLADRRSKEVALGDLDGDGDLDAYVANGSTGAEEDEIWWNNGQGKFSADNQTLDFDWNEGVALGDLDGDGDLDVFLATWFGFDGVWFNQGGRQNGMEGQFMDSGQELSGNSSMDVALIDVDDDQDLDAVVAKWLLPNQVWINNGQGKFSKSDQKLDDSATYEIAAGDLDNDGDPDLVFANNGPNQVWFMGGFRLPSAWFDVDARENTARQQILPWAQAGDAELPIILSFPAPRDMVIQVDIDASGPYVTDVIRYPVPTGQSRVDLRLQNPGLAPTSSLNLTLSTERPGFGRTALRDRVNPLHLLFVDPQQGPVDCILCITDWVLKMAGFEPSFWLLHHMELSDLFNSVSGDYFSAVFQGNRRELTKIILANPGILWQTYDVLQVWTSTVGAYDSGEGDQVIITQEMVNESGDLLEAIMEEASPSMAHTIAREWAALDPASLAGQNMNQAVDRLIDRVQSQVFMPVTVRPEE